MELSAAALALAAVSVVIVYGAAMILLAKAIGRMSRRQALYPDDDLKPTADDADGVDHDD